MATIKMGDKLYLVTRRDIAPGCQAVQSCHAMRQFTADHPDRDGEWFTNSNYLALLSVADEVELMRLIAAAKDLGLRWSAFREPDVGGQITAIAIEPGKQAAELCKALPLALKELS
jgi:peptidyl-tRNA hydrolase